MTTTELVFKIITHVVQVTTVIICIVFVFSEPSTTIYRLFAFGWAMILLSDLIMVVIGLLNPIPNVSIYNFIFPLIQLFCMWFFVAELQGKGLVFILLIFIAFAVLNLLFVQGSAILNTYSLSLGGIIIFLLASSKLYLLWKKETPSSLFAEADFWFCIGFILYWALATPFFSMYNFFGQAYPGFFRIYFFTVSFGATIVLNISIIKALLCSLTTIKKR